MWPSTFQHGSCLLHVSVRFFSFSHNLSKTVLCREKNVSTMEFTQALIYLFHCCIVLVYNLASSLPSIPCQARSQNNSLDKTNERLWKNKALTSKPQIARATVITLKCYFFFSFSKPHTLLSTSQKTTKTRRLLWYSERINLTKQDRIRFIFKLRTYPTYRFITLDMSTFWTTTRGAVHTKL